MIGNVVAAVVCAPFDRKPRLGEEMVDEIKCSEVFAFAAGGPEIVRRNAHEAGPRE